MEFWWCWFQCHSWRLFKETGFDRPLASDELPTKKIIKDLTLHVGFTKFLYGLIQVGPTSEVNMLQNFLNFDHSNDHGMIFFTAGYAFSVFYSNDHVYIHDSHSCNLLGLPDTAGNSVLLKFNSLLDAVRYIHHAYSFLRSSNCKQQYDTVFVSVPSDCILPSARAKFFSNLRVSRKRKHNDMNLCSEKISIIMQKIKKKKQIGLNVNEQQIMKPVSNLYQIKNILANTDEKNKY